MTAANRPEKLVTAEDALKQAILLEMNGHEYFIMAAKMARSEAARELFEFMAKEEEHHLKVLKITFKNLMDSGKWELPTEEELKFAFDDPILNQDFLDKLKDSYFDSSAINVALTLEEKAFKFYQEAEKNTEDPEGKKLFRWLTEWEMEHHERFRKLDDELREEYWNNSNFWPM
ncbi:MAG: ferritin family protein [Candidatus Marinimicrobia bacterium]|nr:ferritin family protein [Candidatus Neomarinimicrobiota bacterium]MCF7840637.1 ferritin family protein [Candidatus Neomarinimicrobiota bacterium]